MQRDARKYLYDIQRAADHIHDFADEKRFADYESDAMLRSAVERRLTIIGEALSQLGRVDAEVVAHIAEVPRIIAFRNILVHGYAEIDHAVVWDIIRSKLPALRADVARLQGGG